MLLWTQKSTQLAHSVTWGRWSQPANQNRCSLTLRFKMAQEKRRESEYVRLYRDCFWVLGYATQMSSYGYQDQR